MAQADCRPAVLIVEDEPLIRMNAVDFAEDAGLRAIEASNADEALAQLDQNDDISILFTDVDMPGSMNGFQLAEVVAQNWPPIGIIIVSGYRRATSGDLPEGGVFFPKPYDIEKVTAALKRIAE
ncbi:response regulator [Agrobacterium rubi]|uniref:response regulator n=1 Tax=Agrobacterium rubi TaxID=28099 RepID=UPI001573CE02|nr:response regulator [Agrobacterium rubi]NTF10695.1 response regulator [Agrobacterium rubi]NTF23089.1 response regulator [Agrobacterium rubi]NTF30020.1 response regulator [Agrobacterium rubi]